MLVGAKLHWVLIRVFSLVVLLGASIVICYEEIGLG